MDRVPQTFLSRYAAVVGYPVAATIALERRHVFALYGVASQCGVRGVVDDSFLDEDLADVVSFVDARLRPLGPGPWFVRYDSLSPKSGRPLRPLATARDVVAQLAGSSRTVAAIDMEAKRCGGGICNALLVYVVPWDGRLSQDDELRVFVARRRLVAVCPYAGGMARTAFADVADDERLRQMVRDVDAFLQPQLGPLCDATACDDLTVDVAMDVATLTPYRIVELNPHGCGSPTGPTLFDWHADRDVLYGAVEGIVLRV
jgi:hypothetical protein